MRAQKMGSPKMPKACDDHLIGGSGLLGLPTPDAERNEKPLAQRRTPTSAPRATTRRRAAA